MVQKHDQTRGGNQPCPLVLCSVKIGNQISPTPQSPNSGGRPPLFTSAVQILVIKFLQIPIMVKSTVPSFWFAEGYDHRTGSLFLVHFFGGSTDLPFGVSVKTGLKSGLPKSEIKGYYPINTSKIVVFWKILYFPHCVENFFGRLRHSLLKECSGEIE